MTEVLGAVASVIALCEAVSFSVSRLIELYKAPAEIKALQEQVNLFHDVVRAVEATSNIPLQPILRVALSRAQIIIKELDQLITTKLIRQNNGSDRARRRTWIKNKRHITRLRVRLQETRKTLWEALSVDILSSTRRIESSLAIISQQPTQKYSPARDTDQKVGDMELALMSQDVVEFNDQSYTCSPKRYVISHESGAVDSGPPRRSATTCDHQFHRPRHSTSENNGTMPALWSPRSHTPSFDLVLAQRVTTDSLRDMPSTVGAEAYTTRTGVPALLYSYSRDIAASEYTRTYDFGFAYYECSRRWIRLTLRITATIESQYWKLEGGKAVGLNDSYSHELPVSLKSILEKSLAKYQNLGQDSYLTVFFGKDSGGNLRQNQSITQGKWSGPHFRQNEYLRSITNMIYHWDCPRYSDRQLDQRPWSKRNPTNSFFAYLDGRWVLASRFGSDQSHIDRDLYILRALHHLRGAPGITPFLGVLLDEYSGIVTAYLCEQPAKGRMCHIIADATQCGHPVAWARRERWCRQIVQGVAEMHSKDFVVGYLGETPCAGVAIDANDNAVFYGRFQITVRQHRHREYELPPEYKQLLYTADEMTVTTETDIYQLGMLLWCIGANKNAMSSRDLCKMAGCTTDTDAICLELHNPLQLCSPGEHIPEYFNDIIAACRRKKPECRPPARELLKMFPPILASHTGNYISSYLDSQDERVKKRFTRPEECLDKFGFLAICDICGEKASHHYFHCSICVLANYDLCRPCFLKGNHCLDMNHYLQEFSEFDDKEKYWTSSKGTTGEREVVDVD